MEINVNWDDLKKKVEAAKLEEDLSTAMLEFMDEFAALPERPRTINPAYMGLCIAWLIDEVCAEEEPTSLSWEMYLDLAKKWAAARGETGKETMQKIAALTPLLATHFSNDDSSVTLQEIDGSSVYNVILLSETLCEPKKFFVAPNANSLAQANFTDKAWFRGIYTGKALVGFVMLSLDEDEAKYFVWRFMIGEPFHGRGYGRKAMEAITAHVRSLPNAETLELSYGQGPGSPEGFYKKLGFEPTGKVEWGEVYARIDLKE